MTRPFFIEIRLATPLVFLLESRTMYGLDLAALKRLDYVRLGFQLEFEDDFQLTLPTLLQLRREFRTVSQYLQTLVADDVALQLRRLFAGDTPTDPVVRRHLSKTPPPFALQIPTNLPVNLEAGDVYELSVLFWGDGRQLAAAFARIVQSLGSQGIHKGEGGFVLTGVVSYSGGGQGQHLWCEGEDSWRTPEWSLLAVDSGESSAHCRDAVLEFISPARLMKKGRPLFRPNLADVFPYILRRVTGIGHAWSGLELLSDPALFFENLPGTCPDQRLHWDDWRELQGEDGTQALGGVVGSLNVPREWLEIAGPILKVGELLNLGKGAAFGSGAWRLI